MKAARATSVSMHISSGSGREEDTPLERRPRVPSGNAMLAARDDRLKAPPQGSFPPQRCAPSVPTAGKPPAEGQGEPMLSIGDIRLKTRPTEGPAPRRAAPPLPTAGRPMPQAEAVVLKTESASLLERQRPAPISTARMPAAGPADVEEWHTPPTSPSQLGSPTSLSSQSAPASPSSMSSPSWPATPETGSPVVSRREGKQTVPQSPPVLHTAGTSTRPPADTAPASPTEALRHPADVMQAGEMANLFAENLEQLRALRVPRLPPFMDRDALVDFNQFLGRHERLLDTRGLREAQDCLRNLLANGVHGGVLPGVSAARLQDLQALSEVNLAELSRPLRQLQADFARIYDHVVNWEGCDQRLFTRRARPIEEIEAERAARIAQDNEALRLGHYTF